jgi:2-dehydropantoate 2-reductase
VTLIARAPWVEAVQSRGLGLEENGQIRFETNLETVTDVSAVEGAAFDLVACTTKAYDAAEAMRQVTSLVADGTSLLLVQNGVGGEQIATKVLPQAQCTTAACTLVVEVLSPGLIRLPTSKGGIGLATVSTGVLLDELAVTLRQAGFERVAVYADYRAMKWSKLLLNMVGNALPTILDMPPAELYAQRLLFDLERAAFREALAVMQGHGLQPVPLPGYPLPLFAWGMVRLPGAVLHPVCRRLLVGGRGGKKPSLYLDLLKGKAKSEVDFLNGAIVEHAHHLGLQAPVNCALHHTLSAIVSGEASWTAFQRQPQKFLTQVGWRP